MYQKRNREQERHEALREALRLKGHDDGMPHRPCAWPGCAAEALYRAPKSRDCLRDFQWFCLEHIREFNRSWNYFAGMSPEQIEAHRRADTTWHRPTWRFGTNTGFADNWNDLFGLFTDGARQERQRRPPPGRPRSKAEEMMARLDLDAGFTLSELKRRYKHLAKQHHPDLHGGDKAAEERLKLINEAYTYLREQRLYA